MNKENRALVAITCIGISSSVTILLAAIYSTSAGAMAAVILMAAFLQERAFYLINSKILSPSVSRPNFPEVIYVLPGNIEMEGGFGGVIPSRRDTVFIDDDVFQVDSCMYDHHTSEVRVILNKL